MWPGCIQGLGFRAPLDDDTRQIQLTAAWRDPAQALFEYCRFHGFVHQRYSYNFNDSGLVIYDLHSFLARCVWAWP